MALRLNFADAQFACFVGIIQNMNEPTNNHGGKRPNAGRKLEIAGAVAKKHTVTIDEMTVRKLKVLGDGNVSKGVRLSADVAFERYQRT